MTELEAAYMSILGYFPTYMRPPYFDTSALVLDTLGGLGYHVIEADIDTLDYENATPDTVVNAFKNFNAGFNAGGTIELSHDVYATTVQTLVQQMIDAIKAKGLTGKVASSLRCCRWKRGFFC
jgi:peptidoglycan/xylan/chitin deacetylase (PgdA/CDA1 family)